MSDNKKGGKFDAVKMMREIRDTVSKQYIENPELEEKDLEFIREKYGIREKEKARH